MSPYALSMLLSSLSTGTVITFISNHWFLAWMGLELNTLAMIPLMSKTHHPRATEAAMKYFLMQAAASALLLFATTLNAWYTGVWTISSMQTPIPMLMLTIALMIKLAIAPFHLWLPDVIQGLDLMTSLILLTWQKLAPMALLIQIEPELNPTLLITFGTMSIALGGWGGLNQPQIRKIMAYSSTAHLGWMLVVLIYSPQLTILNLILYLMMTTSMFLMLLNLSSTSINKMATSWTKNSMLPPMMMMILMSMGGLPPTSGFMPKWLILDELVKQNMTLFATMMAMLALLSLFFYLRLAYSMSLTTPPNLLNSKFLWQFNELNNQTMPMMIIFSIMLLPILPAVLNLF
uniref:NADH-ubiquinone oxidoreductase chain 2 n=3 Tax=Eurycea TaxID=43043 RepID=A0A2L1CEP9_9SALA|nr:NADH dehydrogenase subunit 2 [Eurycea quadridigitata]AVC05300.1 NADH dehydrogenase subunit 2 [Eurycea paludicola]